MKVRVLRPIAERDSEGIMREYPVGSELLMTAERATSLSAAHLVEILSAPTDEPLMKEPEEQSQKPLRVLVPSDRMVRDTKTKGKTKGKR